MTIIIQSVTLMLLTFYIVIAPPVQSEETGEADLATACLDTVWQTVHEYHYDTTFGGLDWQEIHDHYYELAAATEDDSSLIALLNRMLLELKLSHYAVFHVEEKTNSGSRLLSKASIGIDLRLLENKLVITSLIPDFPAAQAGIKPGYLIKYLNGIPVEEILNDAASKHISNFNERRKTKDMCNAALSYCFGQPGDTVAVSYEDETGVIHEAVLQMKERSNGVEVAEGFPKVYLDFKAERISEKVGYINFSAFLPSADSLFIEALNELSDIGGLIIDIRGNPGGMHTVGETIASKLIDKGTPFSVFKYRDSTIEVSLEPNPPIFNGPIAILIDVMNGSASERFSACMQSIGRAVIIGERSPGMVGPSDVKTLPNGASFMYLVAQSRTPDGTVLEGHGVIPDIIVPLERSALLHGVDTQIEQTINYLESRID